MPALPDPQPSSSTFDQRGQTLDVQVNIVGDATQVFVGDYARLADAYIPAQSVLDRVDLPHFTGREWLLAEVDAFLATHDRGYWVLEAPAGLGKTTFFAWLVQQRGYLHHFCELRPGQEGVGAALRNLAAQLAVRYGLGPDDVLPAAAGYPDYLYDLLSQAAALRRPGAQIVLLVDALDEAGTPLHHNVLGLPQTLPEGVYILASQRPLPVALAADTPRTPLVYRRLTGDDDANRDDMRRFLAAAAAWPGIAQALAAGNYTAQQFTDTLLDKCRGVWLYLHFVVHEIDRGERGLLALETLPDGMAHYYAAYWQRWRQAAPGSKTPVDPDWRAVYLPFLAMLAASREPCTVDRLVKWAGIPAAHAADLRDLCAEQWRPFLAISGQSKQARYRFYHASLQEFFEGRLKAERFSAVDDLAADLAGATQAAHGKLCDRYLAAWGGLEAKLPGLREPALRGCDESYGLRHVAAHLEGAGRAKDLHRLLRAEWVSVRAEPVVRSGWRGVVDKALGVRRTQEVRSFQNAWFVTREAIGQTDGYRADVARAMRLADEASDNVTHQDQSSSNLAADAQLSSVGMQCRYSLILASFNSVAMNVPPILLAKLVAHGIWLPQQALTYAQQQSTRTRAEALAALAQYLPKQHIEEALRMVQTIDSGYYQLLALSELVPYLSAKEQEPVVEQMLRTVKAIDDKDVRAQALAFVASHVSTIQLPEALDIAWGLNVILGPAPIWNDSESDKSPLPRIDAFYVPPITECSDAAAQALAAVALRLAATQPTEALQIARGIEHSYYQVQALADLTPYLPAAVQSEVLTEALLAATEIEDASGRVSALARVIPHLSSNDRRLLVDDALRATQTIWQDDDRAHALTDLAPLLASDGRQEVLDEALRLANGIYDSSNHARALAGLAPYLPDDMRKEALRVAMAATQAVWSDYEREQALAELVPLLPDSMRQDVLAEALRTAHVINDGAARVRALARLITHLTESQLNDAQLEETLCMIRALEYREDQLRTLADLGASLSGAMHQKVQDEAMRVIQSIDDGNDRARVLAELATLQPEAQLCTALQVARTIDSSSARATALAGLALHLTNEARQEILDEALRSVQELESLTARDQALADLALQIAQALPGDALHIVQTIEYSYYCAHALVELAPYLSGQQLDEALQTVQAIRGDDARADALTGLAPYLSDQQLDAALRMAQTIQWSYTQSQVVHKLATHLSYIQPIRALRVVQAMERGHDRARALAGLAPHLATLPIAQLYPLWCATLPILAGRTRADLLSDLAALAPVIHRLGGDQAIQEIAQAILDVGRWWP